MANITKELEQAYERIRQDTNYNTIKDLYENILRHSIPIEQSTKEEVWRQQTVVRSYKIELKGSSPYDTFFTLRG